MVNKFDVSVKVKGGGSNSQVDAIKLAIAKSLVVFDPNLRATLKKADLLGRDPRAKERKKFGLKGARKQRQFTKR
jgi:small subunit ribosomal protein S9